MNSKEGIMYKPLKMVLVFLVCFLISGAFTTVSADVTIMPVSPGGPANCVPFGGALTYGPYMGFIYQNVPAFNINPGDILAFDLGAPNDVPIQYDIALAPTTVNGGTVQSGSFVQVVSNTQTPANPTGDSTVGNFELQFTAEASFSFPGGGLIIRFSNPGGAYASDNNCTQVLVYTDSSDSSGYFVQRFYGDANGVSPWSNSYTDHIAGFQVLNRQTTSTSVPTMSEWGMIIFMVFAGLGAISYIRRQRRIIN